MNPTQVAKNRTARLVREAQTPVYSTSTPAREHRMMVESDNDYGRSWHGPMMESSANRFADRLADRGEFSDIDCASSCWCQK